MKGIITEQPLTQLKELAQAGWTINTRHPDGPMEGSKFIAKKCKSIVFKLDKLYKTNIDLIDSLIYQMYPRTVVKGEQTIKYPGRKTLIRVDYDNQTYIINQGTNWKKHPVYLAYLNNIETYHQAKADQQRKELYQQVVDQEVTEEDISFLRAFAWQYDIPVDYTDPIDVVRGLKQVHYYIDNNIEYGLTIDQCSNIEPEETPFKNMVFTKPNQDDTISVEYYGDNEYLEDEVQKCLKLR